MITPSKTPSSESKPERHRSAAQQAARHDFGNVLVAKEATRSTWGWTMLDQCLQDTRYALRSLLKQPGFIADEANPPEISNVVLSHRLWVNRLPAPRS